MVVTHQSAFMIGVLVDIAVPMNCEISFEELKSRMEAHGIGKYAPKARHKADAVRLALAHILNGLGKRGESLGNGTRRILDVTEVPRDKTTPKEDPQTWIIKWKYVDIHDKTINHPLVGNITLTQEGALSVPEELASVADIMAMTQHYQKTAEHTKIRGALEMAIGSISKPLAIRWGKFLPQDRVGFLEQSIAPCFEDLDQGEAKISTLEIANTPKNMETIKDQIEETLDKEIAKIQAAILESSSAGATKGKIEEWFTTIENLKSNMELMGALGVKVPTSLDDLEMKIEGVRNELDAEKKSKQKGRRIHIIAQPSVVVAEEFDLELAE